MRLTRSLLVVLLILSLFIPAFADPLADHVFALVNLQRSANSLPLLTRAPELDTAALRHCTDMATSNFTSHTGSDGSTAGQRITAAGYKWTRYGENIAAGRSNAEATMNDWMNSPGHRANILNPNFKEIGIGVVYRDDSTYGFYWCQDFGTRSTIPVPPAPAPIPPTPPIPTPWRPSLVSVLPRAAWSSATTLTLSGSGFGDARGIGRVTINKMNSQVYAAVTHRTWSASKITVTFQTPQRGWHYVRVERGDGRTSVSALLYVR